MLFSDPPDDVLRHADSVTLIDPNVAGWHLIVVALSDQRSHDTLSFC